MCSSLAVHATNICSFRLKFQKLEHKAFSDLFVFVCLFVIPYVMNFEHQNYLKMWQRSFAKCSWMIRYNIHQYNIMFFPNPYISHLSKVQWFQMIFYTPQCDCRHQLERTGASYITTLLVLFSDNSWISTAISAIHWHFW